jgi:FkbM family methyltransferase
VTRSPGAALYDFVAAASRATPHFRGKWTLVDAAHRALSPLIRTGPSLRLVRMRDGTRLTWDVRDPAERRAVWLGRWDEETRDGVLARLPHGAVVLDVGACVGAWTVPLARASHVARVYAFEPVPSNFERLGDAVAANALRNVTVLPLALGDASRPVEMWLKASQTGAASGTAAVVATGEGQLTVAMTTLDAWAEREQLARLDFIKIDVEGAEFFVLDGAARTVERFRPLILAEFDEYWIGTHGRSRADVVEWAARHRYRPHQWDRGACRFIPGMPPGSDDVLLVPE